ncbi:MAG: BLUF domain-containing protein [Gillisia sp.]
MRFAISYVSTASRDLPKEEIVKILEETQIRNNKHGVNGLLIYSDGNFFEVLEGAEIMIKDLFKIIREDTRHKNILTIFEKEVDKPFFDDKDANFIAENTNYRPMDVRNFLYYIKDLDEGTQKTVINILKAIGANS